MRLTSRQPQSCTTELHRCGHRSRCTDFVAPQSCTDAVTDFVAPQSCTDAATDLVAQISLHRSRCTTELHRCSHRFRCTTELHRCSHRSRCTDLVAPQSCADAAHITSYILCASRTTARASVCSPTLCKEERFTPSAVHTRSTHTSTSPGAYTRRTYTTRSTRTAARASVCSPTLCKKERLTPSAVHTRNTHYTTRSTHTTARASVCSPTLCKKERLTPSAVHTKITHSTYQYFTRSIHQEIIYHQKYTYHCWSKCALTYALQGRMFHTTRSTQMQGQSSCPLEVRPR